MAAMKAALAVANGAFFGVVDWVLDANWAAWSHFWALIARLILRSM
jgi:hypothetical protein